MTHPLQTKEWASFREDWGNQVEWIGKNLTIFSKIPYTKFTIGTCLKCDITGLNLVTLRKIGQKYNAIFIKHEPNIASSKDSDSVKQLLSKNCVPGKSLFTPTTFWIDLTKNEEELMKSFSSKTRYNIKLAQRRGVVVTEDNSDQAFEKYLELTFETAKRQGFYAHTPKYHKLMWKHLKNKIAHLLVAKYNNEIISTWILFAHDGFLYYPYGASSDKYKEVMANNLMMWEAIRLGHKLKLKTFDLWGREEGKGFTRFKEGYNPQVVEFIGSWDLVINKPMYYLYRIAEKIRWFLLRLKK